MQEFARQQGITKQMTQQQEKVMLRYNYIMQQTALHKVTLYAHKDSWANQTKRILAERWKEMQTTFGKPL